MCSDNIMTINDVADTPLVKAWRRDACFGGCAQTCTDINSFLLRKNYSQNPNMQDLVLQLDDYFKYNSLSVGSLLYRGCPKWTVAEALDNGEMIYPAFISTTQECINADTFYERVNECDEPVFLKIILREETPVIDAQSRNYAGIGEGEFILPRNLKLKFYKKCEDGSFELHASRR